MSGSTSNTQLLASQQACQVTVVNRTWTHIASQHSDMVVACTYYSKISSHFGVYINTSNDPNFTCSFSHSLMKSPTGIFKPSNSFALRHYRKVIYICCRCLCIFPLLPGVSPRNFSHKCSPQVHDLNHTHSLVSFKCLIGECSSRLKAVHKARNGVPTSWRTVVYTHLC